MERQALSAITGDFLQAGGDLGALIRAKNWDTSAIGPPESWPQSLRTVVSLCLASNFPINIIWGPDHTQIYNDGYRDVCGDAHPTALGQNYRVTWASAWPAIGDPFARALAGETSYLENQRMFLTRNGYLEETFFTFSHSPIRDESGGIGGLFHPVTETTATMLAERRTRALRDLSSDLATATDEATLCAAAVRTLSRFDFDLPFLLYYHYDDATESYELGAHYGIEPEAAAQFPWPFDETNAQAGIVQVDELRSRWGVSPCGPYEECANRAFVIPVALHRSKAMLVAGVSPRLPFNDAYRTFFELLGVTLSSAYAAVRAREDERRRSESLAEVDRAKTAFFSNVSHEFRTPLTLMLGPLEEMLADPHAGAQHAQLAMVHRNGQRLLRLVNALLDFSRVEAGRAQATYVPLDLASLTGDLASNFQSACAEAGISFSVDCPPLREPVFVDPTMWETIVLNLLSNAFKFTLAGGIEIGVRADGDEAVLTVADSGTGIPQAELPRIFQRFHRVEATHGRTHEGSGIGLALVAEFVELHHGRVEVASRFGEGTTFTVRLPFGTAHLDPTRISDAKPGSLIARRATAFVEEARRWIPATPVKNGGGQRVNGTEPSTALERPRVLLVDDSADMREYVTGLLSQTYDVRTANDGIEALELIEESIPDLVLSDIMMPRLDGLGLVAALRERPEYADVRIVLISARAGEGARTAGLLSGADDYLVKPFSAEELLARVATNVHVARLRRVADDALRSRDRERRIAQTFQDAALPAQIADLPGLSFSAFYKPGSEESTVGGDFYDAFRLLDGRVVISIGDVAGAGVTAAATMVSVRQSIRAVASVNPEPLMLLKAAEEVFSGSDRPAFGSVFVAVIEPLTFSIQYASAGHPPPLLRTPSGDVIALESGDLLLGVSPDDEHGSRQVHHIVVEPGSVLVLYTDGITEAGRAALDGQIRLTDVVRKLDEGVRSAGAMAKSIHDRVLGTTGIAHDDIAILTVDFAQPLTTCGDGNVRRWRFDAHNGDDAQRTGAELREHLAGAQFSDDAVFTAQMIFSELIGNVVRHAGSDVDVLLDMTQSASVLHILDSGDGFALNLKLPSDAYAERGRGLFIVSRLARDFTVSPRVVNPGSHARAVLAGR